MKFFLLLLPGIILFFSSCTLFESGNEIPEFITVDEVSLTTLPDEGANTSQIEDVWVFADGQSLGVFELPATIPVIPVDDVTDLLFFAGIRLNGINSNADFYPLYESIEISKNLVPGNQESLDLNFHYKPNVTFIFIEGFESNHLFHIDRDGDSSTSLVSSSAEALTGSKSGLIEVSEEAPVTEVASSTIFERDDVQSRALFLELDYMNEAELLIGLVGLQGLESFESLKLGLRPRAEWNKVYVELASDVNASQLDKYRILFRVQFTGDQGEVQKVYLDNVKLVYL